MTGRGYQHELGPSRKGAAVLHRLGVTLPYESSIEAGLLRLLDWHPHVQAVRRAESISVYDPDGTRHTYTPDLDVDLEDGRTLSLEAKPGALLPELLGGHEATWQARITVLEHAGRTLQVVTEQDLNPVLLAQAQAFGHFHAVEPDSTLRQAILTLLRERGAYPLSALRQVLQAGTSHDLAVIDVTLSGMIARREVLLDPERPPHNSVVDLPRHAGALLPPPLGRPLRAVLAALATLPAPTTKAAAAPDPARHLEARLLETARGQQWLRLFTLYNDPGGTLDQDRAAELGRDVGLSDRTVYRFRQTLLAAGAPGITFTDLVPYLVPGTRRPTRRLDARVEAIIERLATEHFFQPVGTAERARGMSDLHRLVRQACLAEELPPPALTTVQRHITRMTLRDPIRAAEAREGRERAQALEPRQGGLEVTRYGELWGIDCSPCDVFTVSGETRLRLGQSGRGQGQRQKNAVRGNIVTVVDVATSQVLRSTVFPGGIGAAQILTVLRSVFLGDTHDLTAAGVTTVPQARGLPQRVRMDAGTEFVNRQVARVLGQLGIEVVARNKWSRHHGGIEERTIGTLTHAHHVLPGTSMNNTGARGEYQAQRRATLTLTDLDCFHQRVVQQHNLQCAPLNAMTRQDHAASLLESGRTALRPLSPSQLAYVRDRMQPQETRKCQRGGVSLHGLMYVAAALAPLIVRQAEVLISWNPDDISVAQAVHPDTGELIALRARLPQGLSAPLSLRDWDDIRRQMRTAQEVARDRACTPQQIVREVMAEREQEKAPKRSRKDRAARGMKVQTLKLKPAPEEAATEKPRIKAAEIEFDTNPVKA